MTENIPKLLRYNDWEYSKMLTSYSGNQAKKKNTKK